jgi:hypothetical protein
MYLSLGWGLIDCWGPGDESGEGMGGWKSGLEPGRVESPGAGPGCRGSSGGSCDESEPGVERKASGVFCDRSKVIELIL